MSRWNPPEDWTGYWRTRTYLDGEWGVPGYPPPLVPPRPAHGMPRRGRIAAILGLGAAIVLSGCGAKLWPPMACLGDCMVCEGEVTYDATDGSLICEGESVWTGHISPAGAELGGKVAEGVAKGLVP